MPRKGPAPKKQAMPDPVYNNILVTRFVNRLMMRGKKSLAEKIFYRALDIIAERSGRQPLEVFEKAVNNVKPAVEVKPRRIGGATYQVPVEVRSERQVSLAIRWLIASARKRAGKNMQEKLATELLEAAQNTGASIKKKEDTYKMAEANKAFAHYRW